MLLLQMRNQKELSEKKPDESVKKNYKNAEAAEMMRNIARTRLELEVANQNFSYALEPLLVDMYSYQIKAAQAKYRYLLKKARDMGLEQREYVERAVMEANNI